MAPLYASIAGARQPYSALNWLRSGAGAAILADLSSGALALTHEALDADPRRGGAEYVRQMLVANGALSPRNEVLARLERWVQAKLKELGRPEDRRVVQTYATWSVMARLRRRAEAGAVVRPAAAKIRIGAAVRLVHWIEQQQLRLETLCQRDIEEWLVSDPPSTYDVRDFLRWAAGQKVVADLEVPAPVIRTGTALDEERRWEIVERLLHDDAVDLTDRVAGCLLLLYAQQLSRIVAMKVEDVVDRGDGVRLRVGTEELAVPEPLGGLIATLAATGRRYLGVGTPASTPWLFPGLMPGRPLTAARLGDRLGNLGVDARAGRRAALMHLAARLPAAVLAEVLNLSPGTAVDWVRAAGGDWSSYAAQVAGARDREMC
jgi:integrase